MSTVAIESALSSSSAICGNHLDELSDNLSYFSFNRSYDNDDNSLIEDIDEINKLLDDDRKDIGEANNVRPLLIRQSSNPAAQRAHAASQGRILRKARLGNRSHSISEDGKFGGMASFGSNQRCILKNSRKSRTCGRGLPKKGGAGGKGTWGKLGCELELPWVDPNDPNYDSDNDEKSDNVLFGSSPQLSDENMKKELQHAILEFFQVNDSMEVLHTLQEILVNLGNRRWMIVSILIELAMDHKPSHREMASTLISDLYQKVISQKDIGIAFDYLIRQIDDLILDIPEAPTILGNFLARAIADDCIPPKFLYSYKGKVETTEAKDALRRADTLLSMKHGMVRLDTVWGVGGGLRPVVYLTKNIVLLLKEYLYSGDVIEAGRCLIELEVPHFHHELVYRVVVMVIESIDRKTQDAMLKLLTYLFGSFIISIDQMVNGFQRVYQDIAELSVDVPAAYTILENFVKQCRSKGLITNEVVRKMPHRRRKHFISMCADGQR